MNSTGRSRKASHRQKRMPRHGTETSRNVPAVEHGSVQQGQGVNSIGSKA